MCRHNGRKPTSRDARHVHRVRDRQQRHQTVMHTHTHTYIYMYIYTHGGHHSVDLLDGMAQGGGLEPNELVRVQQLVQLQLLVEIRTCALVATVWQRGSQCVCMYICCDGMYVCLCVCFRTCACVHVCKCVCVCVCKCVCVCVRCDHHQPSTTANRSGSNSSEGSRIASLDKRGASLLVSREPSPPLSMCVTSLSFSRPPHTHTHISYPNFYSRRTTRIPKTSLTNRGPLHPKTPPHHHMRWLPSSSAQDTCQVEEQHNTQKWEKKKEKKKFPRRGSNPESLAHKIRLLHQGKNQRIDRFCYAGKGAAMHGNRTGDPHRQRRCAHRLDPRALLGTMEQQADVLCAKGLSRQKMARPVRIWRPFFWALSSSCSMHRCVS